MMKLRPFLLANATVFILTATGTLLANTDYESMLPPGARLVAGDPAKNEFYILASNKRAETVETQAAQPAAPMKAPVVAQSHVQQVKPALVKALAYVPERKPVTAVQVQSIKEMVAAINRASIIPAKPRVALRVKQTKAKVAIVKVMKPKFAMAPVKHAKPKVVVAKSKQLKPKLAVKVKSTRPLMHAQAKHKSVIALHQPMLRHAPASKTKHVAMAHHKRESTVVRPVIDIRKVASAKTAKATLHQANKKMKPRTVAMHMPANKKLKPRVVAAANRPVSVVKHSVKPLHAAKHTSQHLAANKVKNKKLV